VLRAVVVAIALLVVAGAGCSDDGPDDPAEVLADRISAILEGDGDAVLQRLEEGGLGVSAEELADADVVCPRVTDPAPGDLATCNLTTDEVELELDVEFREDGGLEVVQVAVAP
jgi:hypothetical protein